MSLKNKPGIKAGLKKLANATSRFSAADLEIKPYDAADYLTSEARIAGYLNEATATGDPAVIQLALGAIARARGMSKVAKASGLSRENLYRSLSPNTATNFSTVVSVAGALGYDVTFKLKPGKIRAPRKTRAKVGTVIAGKGVRKVASSPRHFKKAVKR